jgi:hypothetical protein
MALVAVGITQVLMLEPMAALALLEEVVAEEQAVLRAMVARALLAAAAVVTVLRITVAMVVTVLADLVARAPTLAGLAAVVRDI